MFLHTCNVESASLNKKLQAEQTKKLKNEIMSKHKSEHSCTITQKMGGDGKFETITKKFLSESFSSDLFFSEGKCNKKEFFFLRNIKKERKNLLFSHRYITHTFIHHWRIERQSFYS